ncbi:MAG: YfhO family protein, partial [Balneolaceae bacterium]
GSGLTLDYAFAWSQGILESLTLIIPNLFGGDSGMAYWGEKPGTSGPHYLGAIAFLLFLIGIFRSRRKIKFLFFGIGLLALTFSWGYHFPPNTLWFNILPGFDKFRTPEMWLIVTVFTSSVIAVFGLETCFRLIKHQKNGLKELYMPAGIAFGLGIVLLLGSGTIFPFESDREHALIAEQIAAQNDLSPDNRQVRQRVNQIIETRFKPERRSLARNDILRYLLLVGAAILMIAFYLQSRISSEFLAAALILLASLDLLTAGSRYISDDALVDRQVELTDAIEARQSPVDGYIAEIVESPAGYPYRALPLDDNPFNNAIPSYFYPSIGGYSGAKLSIIQDVLDQGLFTGSLGINKELLDMLNIRYISARGELPLRGFREIHTRGDYYVYENTGVMPKAWFVDSVQPAGSPQEAFDMILPDGGFDPAEYAVVETVSEPDIRDDPDATVDVTAYSARNIELDISRSGPGFLVLSEIFYPPGWSATLNGEEIPIYKTNYLLRGFAIPDGEHTLALAFNPVSHIWGSRISWAANLLQWLAGAVLLAFWWKRRRRPDTADGA